MIKKISPFGKKILKYFLNNDEGIVTQLDLSAVIDVSQSTISKIISGYRAGTGPAGLKIAEKIGLSFNEYVKLTRWSIRESYRKQLIGVVASVEETEPAAVQPSNFDGVYAYDLPTGLTYMGIPNDSRLENACIVPTDLIARESIRYHTSLTNVERRIYETFRNRRSLSDIAEFTPLEKIAKNYLGKEK